MELKLTKDNLCAIINPAAKCRRSAGLFEKRYFPQICEILGFKVEHFLTNSALHASELIDELQGRGFSIFLIFGGDGTINDCLQNFGTDSVLLPVPLGSANDFSRRLGFYKPDDSFAALKRIKAGADNIKKMDLGAAESEGEIKRIFVNHFGLGVTARCVHMAEESWLKIYLLIGLFSLFKALPFPIKIDFGGKTLEESILGFEFLLTRTVGKIINIAPYKVEGDGTFSLFKIGVLSSLGKFNLIARMPFGKLLPRMSQLTLLDNNFPENQKDFTPFQSAVVSGNNWKDRLFHVDGNPLDSSLFSVGSPIKIFVKQKALSVIYSGE
ncbi:diacylglycerol/lipid kinase family protein [Candidatus Riflebacteria bacterium]